MIALCFLQHGATLVHGFDKKNARVDHANKLCEEFKGSWFRVADIEDWETVNGREGPAMLSIYDISLYLGVNHHLSENKRMEVLKKICERTKDCLAIRTKKLLFIKEQIDTAVNKYGFK